MPLRIREVEQVVLEVLKEVPLELPLLCRILLTTMMAESADQLDDVLMMKLTIVASLP